MVIMSSTKGRGLFQPPHGEMISSALGLFEPEIVESKVIGNKQCIIRPQSIPENGPIQVHIPAEGSYYVDTSSIRANMDFKIQKQDGDGDWIDIKPEVDEPSVAPVNLFTKAMFKDVECWLNQKQISLVASTAYHLKAYLETVCTYSGDAARTHLQCSFLHMDVPGKYDTFPSGAHVNRAKHIMNGRQIQSTDTIHTELTTMDKYLLPGVTIDFRFSLNSPSMYLQSYAGIHLGLRAVISDFYLSFDRIEVEPTIARHIESQLSQVHSAIYGINRGTIRTKQFGAGEIYAKWQGLYTGQLPSTIIFGMLDSTAYNGAVGTNPFNFQHFKVNSVQLKKNSTSIPASPLTPDFTKLMANRSYRHFLDAIGVKTGNAPCLIDYAAFLGGATLFAFDLTPDKCASLHGHPKENGVLDIDFRFAEPLEKNITIFALCNFDDQILISGPMENREIYINPTIQG